TGSQINAAVTATLIGHQGRVHGIATVTVDNRPLAISAGTDGTIRVWNLPRGVADGRTWHTPALWGQVVAGTHIAGRPVAITNGDDLTLRAYDVEAGDQVGEPMRHPAEIVALTVTSGSGPALAVSSTAAGSVHR